MSTRESPFVPSSGIIRINGICQLTVGISSRQTRATAKPSPLGRSHVVIARVCFIAVEAKVKTHIPRRDVICRVSRLNSDLAPRKVDKRTDS
ncbi:hypothetical protein H1P_2730014 [Hyella patelloides LEGE 07179]|uniref:Uncharacterized protein n=1 Tax=Hyella patelloides LEGE 07179 TaxID=945734 RepID=A0A563VT88_9CYAN|nr:hypothetical protein H1P_2730014 [Hyella patelloides LEGE 07179]